MNSLNSDSEIAEKIDELWTNVWSGGISNPLTAMENISYILLKEYVHRPSHPSSKALSKSFTRNYLNKIAFTISGTQLLEDIRKILDAIYHLIDKKSEETEQDFYELQGDFYQSLLKEVATNRKNGQFPVPPSIIELLIALIEPKIGQKIVDPICGTGEFLLEVYHHLKTQTGQHLVQISKGKRREEQEILQAIGQNLFGFEIDQRMSKFSFVNLLLHGIQKPKITFMDTLSKVFSTKQKYQLVLSGIPFSGYVDQGDINNELTLETTRRDLLYIERIYQTLEHKGTAGIIINQNILSNQGASFKEIRQFLIEKTNLKAVIKLPHDTYQPYTKIKAAILIFTKGEKTKNVWFCDMEDEQYLKEIQNKPEKEEKIIIEIFKNKKIKSTTKINTWHSVVSVASINTNKYNLDFENYKKDNFTIVKQKKPKDTSSKTILVELINSDKIKKQKVEKDSAYFQNAFKRLFGKQLFSFDEFKSIARKDNAINEDYEIWKKYFFQFINSTPNIIEQVFDEEDNTIKFKLTNEAFKA